MWLLYVFLGYVLGYYTGYALGKSKHHRRGHVPPLPPPPTVPVRLEFHVGQSEQAVTMLNIKDNEQVDLSVVAKDAKGAVTTIENPVYALTDPSLGTLSVDPADGTKATFVAGTPGSGQISFSADPTGPNDTPLVAQLDVTVLAGDAAVLEINTGAVSPQ